jgi:hypothetical protein
MAASGQEAAGGGGGGIAVRHADLTVTASDVTDNSSFGSQFCEITICTPLAASGGGVWALDAGVTLHDASLDSNGAGSGGSGGGVAVIDSDITIDQGSTLADNGAARGGGAWFYGTTDATLIDTSIDANGATWGGGLYNTGTLEVRRSTIADNIAYSVSDPYWFGGLGGGVLNAGATASASIVSSTIDANIAYYQGGGIANGGNDLGGDFATGGSVTLTASTIAANQAGFGPGISRDGGTFTVLGSILDNEDADCMGTISSGGYNLASDATCTSFVQVGDVQSMDPLLGPLADNGGPTFTRLPGVGSLARDAIPSGTASLCDGAVPTDQRGIARPQGSACDRGSVEQ